ncbi:Na+/H+ antiporter NhaC family protein [Halorientalis salina]|uniref:Na+/H+ antiporter NhaC family protein n=1 Tax=Halorientalis salina TaxID=2932266 RepID=UPI0010AB9A78|nr:Na+/H+ antiporter NhaC family protein [Halorientalis salina]
MADYGLVSLVPPLLAIGLAIVTRKAVLSLFLGIWAGGALVSGGLGLVRTFDWIVAAMADELHARILLFTLLLGSGVGMVWRLGGSQALRNWAIERLDTPRKAGLVAWLLGLLLFFDDYANTAIVGSTMKDVSDRLSVSREKLSYIVDSTAAPVATLGISSWVAFQLGLIADAYAELGVDSAPPAFEVFLRSIPFNAYAILAIAMVAIVVASGRDYGEMLDAEARARRTGEVVREGATPMQDVEGTLGEPRATRPRLLAFFGPVAVLIAVTVGAALWTGYEPGASAYDVVTGADYAAALVYGSFAMVGSGFVLGRVLTIMTLGELTDTVVDGFGVMLTAVSILVLAWGLGEAVEALGTGRYVAGYAESVIDPAVLPVIVLLTGAFVAFSTGTSWGAMAILTPIVVPVAWNLTGDHTMVAAVVGAVFSGAIFGDHTSPISDTTVLSATFTGADLIDHVRTQLYYAVTVAAVAIAVLLAWGVTGVTTLVWLPLGALALVGLVYVLSTLDAARKDVDPAVATTTGDRADDTSGSSGTERTDPVPERAREE